ncbi:MAG: hypothetical protein NC335_04250, partial [Bacteroides sp.]|nr:hypothetical protein [Bacteroides sp.]
CGTAADRGRSTMRGAGWQRWQPTGDGDRQYMAQDKDCRDRLAENMTNLHCGTAADRGRSTMRGAGWQQWQPTGDGEQQRDAEQQQGNVEVQQRGT